MTLSVVCQAQPLIRRFVVELEQKAGSPNQNVFITPDQHTLSYTLSDIAHTKGYAGSDLSSDQKQGRLNGCGLKTTTIESISWQWLYATRLLVVYELILNTKNTPLNSTSYSWLPVEMVIAVGWLLKNYWNIDSPSFNPMTQKELCQDHPFSAIITIPGTGNNQQQRPPSESSGQQAQEATAHSTDTFNSFLYSDSADGSGGSQQHLHTLDLNCFVSPCHGVCQFRPSSDSCGSAEWPMNSAAHSTGHTAATPGQSSCPHVENGHCPECAGHVTNTDELLMDSIPRPAISVDTDVPPESDPCPICRIHFHDRDVALVVVKSQCCGKRFDLDCISRCFVQHPIGSRRCVMCRQNPMPMVNENTGESHPDTFFPDQTFYRACFEGDLDQVEKSLAEGVNVNAVMNNDLTPLMLSCIRGHRDVFECLINAGADLNERTINGATLMIIAAKRGHTGIVKLLIEAKADFNAQNKDGTSALYIAAQENNTDCVKILIEARADLNARPYNDATPLTIAAQYGHTDIVKLLIEAGADLNARNNNGTTPLIIAAQNGHTDIVKLLIEANVDLNARSKNGGTALFIAVQQNNTDCVKVLINAGADLDAAMTNGTTPLLIAAARGNIDCVKILIEAGADFNARSNSGITPLFMAAQNGHTDIVKLLIEAKADLNTQTNMGATPLFMAAQNGYTDIVKLLIEARADLNAAVWDGTTPMSIATAMGNIDCVKALTGTGAR